MTHPSPSRRHVLAGSGLLLLLAGCGTTPPPRLFTLAPRPATPSRPLAAAIAVRRVQLPKYLDRLQIVSYRDPYELQYSEFFIWGENLSDMTTRVLVANLSERLPHSQVYLSAGSFADATADITLETSIDKFDPDPAGVVILSAQWAAHRQGYPDQIRSEQIRVTPSSKDPTGQVAAMSDALGQLADRIVAGLPAAVAPAATASPRPKAR
ncbi:MAG TPA: PqiC family protein [Stellaceae bacterium]|nr:PqiC family protein [Stellaceae bacterium]